MSEPLNIDQFNSLVKNLLNHLPDEIVLMNQKLAANAIPKIQNRLIDEGKTAEGASLGKYSDRPLSPLMLIQQSSGKGAAARVLAEAKRNKSKGIKGISYERFRELNNLPTQHVTLSFTGETLGDIKVISDQIEGARVTTVVASQDSHSKNIYNKKGKLTGTKTTGKVLEDLDDKYGRALDTELLSLSKEEIIDLQEQQDMMLQQFVNKYFS